MRKLLIGTSLYTAVLFSWSCQKAEGSGGSSSIKGKVWTRFHDKNAGYIVKDDYPAADQDVYIIYGDELSYGDRIKTDYEGDFEFKYLRKGKYKIYVYSEDSSAIVATNPLNLDAPNRAVIAEVEISKNKSENEAGTLIIHQH